MKILLAGGGTAGHIEPALAVARSLRKSHPTCELLFLGSKEGLENKIIPEAGFELFLIPKVRVPRRITPALFLAPFALLAAIRRSAEALTGVDAAIGFGGYISAPLYIAAKLKRVPFLIHEQNAKPGWANRFGAYLTPHVALSYRVKTGALNKGVFTGVPLRQDVSGALQNAQANWVQARLEAKKRVSAIYEIDPTLPLIFIFGGSQGSLAINDVVAKSREVFKARNFSVIHGVGRGNALPARDSSYVALDYITEMADLYLASDIVIARSGAVTCAEVGAIARFALFIPLPIGNGEQAMNAAPLLLSGRASLVEQREFTPEWVENNLTELAEQSRNAPVQGDVSAIDAADRIATMIEKIASA
jgi:UDP-N-acetylglucosamine--N-acetylmuramyl-(pentapeptide) pyrophosphoryl-undecaprenol N-acetylglucosamine transferase